jgi:hypothetical protein
VLAHTTRSDKPARLSRTDTLPEGYPTNVNPKRMIC